MSDVNQKFEMGPEDCAIIIKKDMSSEMIIPKFADDVQVSWEDNQNMFITVAISSCMGEPDFRAVITKKLDQMMAMGQEQAEKPEGGCAGGCCGPQDSEKDCADKGCCGPTTDGDTADE